MRTMRRKKKKKKKNNNHNNNKNNNNKTMNIHQTKTTSVTLHRPSIRQEDQMNMHQMKNNKLMFYYNQMML